LPSAELKARAREWVRELSAAGTPSLHVQDGAFRLDFQPGAWATQGTIAPAGMPLLCWLFPDAVIAKLDALIDHGVSGTGLASTERPKREGQLQGKLAALMRDEEALIERHESEFDIPRRPTADPLAILGIRYGLQQARAS
jgi:hypothetical protein